MDALAALANEKGVSSATLAIAWSLRKGDFIVPVIGYAGIFIFALAAARVKGAEHATVALPAGH